MQLFALIRKPPLKLQLRVSKITTNKNDIAIILKIPGPAKHQLDLKRSPSPKIPDAANNTYTFEYL